MSRWEEILIKIDQLTRQCNGIVKTVSELQFLVSKEILAQNKIKDDSIHKH